MSVDQQHNGGTRLARSFSPTPRVGARPEQARNTPPAHAGPTPPGLREISSRRSSQHGAYLAGPAREHIMKARPITASAMYASVSRRPRGRTPRIILRVPATAICGYDATSIGASSGMKSGDIPATNSGIVETSEPASRTLKRGDRVGCALNIHAAPVLLRPANCSRLLRQTRRGTIRNTEKNTAPVPHLATATHGGFPVARALVRVPKANVGRVIPTDAEPTSGAVYRHPARAIRPG